MLRLPFFDMLAEEECSAVVPKLVTGHLQRSEESEAFIAAAKAERTARGIKPWPNDAKPSRFHFAGAEYQTKTGVLVVHVEPCVSYDDHAAGTTKEFFDRYGRAYLPNALATTVILESGGHILVSHRKKADYKKEGLHFSIGGFIEIKHEPDGDPVHAVKRELFEETGISPEEIVDLTCIGIAWDPWQNKPDILFSARTATPTPELRRAKTDKENINYWMPFSKESTAKLMRGSMHSAVPMGMAALLYLGRERFGTEWFNDRVREIAEAGEGYDNPTVRQEAEVRDIKRVPELLKELCGTHENA